MLGQASSSISLPCHRPNPLLASHISSKNSCKIPTRRKNCSFFKVQSYTTTDGLLECDSSPAQYNLKLPGKPTPINKISVISTPSQEINEEREQGEDGDLKHYKSKAGDLVAGVVVSRIGNKLHVDIGSEKLACMSLNEFYPINKSETKQIACRMAISEENCEDQDCHRRFRNGKMGIFMDKEVGEATSNNGFMGVAIEEGTVVYAEVLGSTTTGEPLISGRRVARKLAWQRVRQIKKENEPIEIYISEWNSSGLVARIEGLRAFLPKLQMVNPPFYNFAVLKEHVGTWMEVVIINVDEASGDLTVSERVAWEMRNLYEGNLLQGTITKLFPYGAAINIDGTSISCLLHISNISCANVSCLSDLFSKGENVKAMVIRSNFPDKAEFSTADLESEKGLILSNKEKVFREAEKIAASYRSRLSNVWCMHQKESRIDDIKTCAYSNECYANWDWFRFEPVSGSSSTHC